MIHNYRNFYKHNREFKITDHHPKLKWDGRDFPKSQQLFHMNDKKVISFFKSFSFEALAAIAATPNRQLVWMTHDLLYEKFIRLIIHWPACRVKRWADYKAVILYCGTRLYVRETLSDLSLKNIRSYFIKKNKLKKGLSTIEVGLDYRTGSIVEMRYNYGGLGNLIFLTEANWACALCEQHPNIDSLVKKVMANEDRIFNEILWKTGKLKTIRFKEQLFWQRRTYFQIFFFSACLAIFSTIIIHNLTTHSK